MAIHEKSDASKQKKNINNATEKMIWKSGKASKNPFIKTQPKRAHLLYHETAAQSYRVLHVAIG